LQNLAWICSISTANDVPQISAPYRRIGFINESNNSKCSEWEKCQNVYKKPLLKQSPFWLV